MTGKSVLRFFKLWCTVVSLGCADGISVSYHDILSYFQLTSILASVICSKYHIEVNVSWWTV